MTGRRYAAIAVWMTAMAICIGLIARSGISTDMTAFLPRSPSAAQQVLVDQVRNGVVSRLILLGVEGAPPETLAAVSKAMARHLRANPAFPSVDNGEEAAFGPERDMLWRNRYLLSPGALPERFTAAGLRKVLENDLRLLGSDLAPLVKSSLPNDPTGEILTLVDELAGTTRPHAREGVWFSRNDRRALLLAQTRAAGFDIDAQQRALTLIEAAFDQARREVPGAGEARLLETGPAVFAVRTRATMERDAARFSLLATALVAALLLFAYRSPRLLLLGLLPVLSGAVAGVAAVALGFGFVHGITLGFGVTLIGESVDYAIYLFTQTAPGSSPDRTLARIWPTLRLGVLTSIAGFSAMLFSSFTGFAQLGLFSIVGLIMAVSVTRWVLPTLLPSHFTTLKSNIFAPPLLAVMRYARPLRIGIALLVVAAIGLLFLHHDGFWQEDISSMSPIKSADQALDRALRADVGAPDVRYLLVLAGTGEQQALSESERLSAALEGLVKQNLLTGFDAPDRYLPSERAQAARRAALPSTEVLGANLQEALAGLPFRPDLFAPFIADIAAAKTAPNLTRESLPPALSLKLDTLLFERSGEWITVLPLHGVSDPSRVASAVTGLNEPGVTFVDLKSESDRLLQTYQHEAMMLALIGSLVVLALLSVSLRSPRRVFVVAAPLAGAVTVTAAVLSIGDQKLSIFNLVGLMLIVAVGSNYCLFFERQAHDSKHRERSVASLALANLCTVIGFGVLSFSGIPVLHDIGMTVALGAFLSLFFAAILSAGNHAIRGTRRDRPPFDTVIPPVVGSKRKYARFGSVMQRAARMAWGRCIGAIGAVLGLAACSTAHIDTGPTTGAEEVYASLFPYYAELCAVSELKKKHGFGAEISSGVGGHAVFYLNGVCRVDDSHYPVIRLCDESAPPAERGVGISVNAHYKNANWIATPGREFFFHGGLAPGEPVTRATYQRTQDRAKALGILDGIEFHDGVFEDAPLNMSRRDYKYDVSVATDYAIGFGRDRYCARVPLDRERMARIVDFMNALNADYRDGKKEFDWDVLSNNCSHVAHNALAVAGVWSTWETRRFFLFSAFDFPVPKNEFVNLMQRTNDLDIHDLDEVYDDDAARQALMRLDVLPTVQGAIAEAEPAVQRNEVYDTDLSLIFYDDPITGRYRMRFDRIFAEPRYTDLRANLRHFADLYGKIRRERRPLASFLADQKWRAPTERDRLASFYTRYYEYIERQDAAVAAELAALPRSAATFAQSHGSGGGTAAPP